MKRFLFLGLFFGAVAFLLVISACGNGSREIELEKEKVYILMEEGDFRKADEQIDELMKKVGKNADILVLKGYVQYIMGKEKEATEIFEKVKGNYKKITLHNRLLYAKFLIEHLNMDEARRVVDSVLKEDRENMIGLYYMGLINKNSGKISLAIENFERIMSYSNLINKVKGEYDNLLGLLNKNSNVVSNK